VAGVPAGFPDDAAEREEIAGIAIARARFRYQQQFDRIILVGDSDCDVATAARLGVGFVGIASDANEVVLRAAGAPHRLRNYEDFGTFMRAVEMQAGGVADTNVHGLGFPRLPTPVIRRRSSSGRIDLRNRSLGNQAHDADYRR
jgi:hypothetical protein